MKLTFPEPPTPAEAEALFKPMERYGLGCHFASVILDVFFLGILSMQVAHHAANMRNDGLYSRITVGLATIMAVGTSGYVLWFMDHLFVSNFGEYTQFFEPQYLAWFPTLDSITISMVQSFFAYRAYLLNDRNWVLYMTILMLVVGHFVSAIVVTVQFTKLASELDAGLVRGPIQSWLAFTMAADILITLSVMRGLLKAKTGWQHTDRQISRLVRMTVEAQLPPTLVAIAFMIESNIDPANLLGATLQVVQSKVYIIGLLFALNSRSTFNRNSDSDDKAQVYRSNNGFPVKTNEIRVTTEMHTWVEGEDDHKASSKDEYELQDAPAMDSRTQLTPIAH